MVESNKCLDFFDNYGRNGIKINVNSKILVLCGHNIQVRNRFFKLCSAVDFNVIACDIACNILCAIFYY